MAKTISTSTLEKFTTFGDMLRFLRRRAGITQTELSIAVGYSSSQISRLEQNLRMPDPSTIAARFVPVLNLDDEPEAVSRLLELASTVRREDAPVVGLCPYKGLDYFDEADVDLFVGREALTEKITGRLLALASSKNIPHGRVLAIVGASGSGKSSLVRAGLVPALHWNKLSAHWPIHVLTPTAHPLETLATAISPENSSVSMVADLMDDFATESRALYLFLKREMNNSRSSYLVIIVDQFEELFTLCRSEDERSAFIANLINAASSDSNGAIVLITLRSDFYTHCANYPQLRQALAAQQEFIGAMSDEEMRRAIEEPARRGHWEFEPGLVDLILHDVGHEPGALPLLSHALYETWHRRHGRTMTLSGYISAGGVRGAIAETAESVFTDQFTPEQQAIARRIFIRLTELGDETATGDTRRRASIAELVQKLEETDAIKGVLHVLADARLITIGEDTVQVAHEALIREWPTLRGWLEENRQGLRTHRQLTDASMDWLATEREPGILFRGARLAQAREWADAHPEDLNVQEQEFLAASVSLGEREASEREARHRRELDTIQRLADTERQQKEERLNSAQRLKRRSILISLVSILAVMVTIFGIFSWRNSIDQSALTQSKSLASYAIKAQQSGQGDLALTLAREAVKINNPPVEAVAALRSVAQGFGKRAILDGQSLKAITISPDSKMALVGGCARKGAQNICLEGQVALIDIFAAKEIRRWSAHANWVTAVAISVDGQILVSGSADGSLLLWDRQGKQIGELETQAGSITNLAILPNYGTLLVISADGNMTIWELRTREQIFRFSSSASPITSLAVAASAPYVVTNHLDGSVKLWNLHDRVPVKAFTDLGSGIQAVLIDPDANWILLTSNSLVRHSLIKVDVQSGDVLNQLAFPCSLGSMALSPDASYAIVVCQTAIYQVNIQAWQLDQALTESSQELVVIGISPDGQIAISGSSDGVITLWNLGLSTEYQAVPIYADILDGMDISPDGESLLLNDSTQNGYEWPVLWDILSQKVTHSYYTMRGSISPGAVAISPDTNYIAVTGWQTGFNVQDVISQTVVIWNDNGTIHCQQTIPGTSGKSIRFSPDSKYLLTSSQDAESETGQLKLWNVADCSLARRFEMDEVVSSVAFNSDGSRLITGMAYDEGVILWDVATGEPLRRYSYMPGGVVLSAVFGPQDATILGAGLGELVLWDVKTGDIIGRFAGASAYPQHISISSDGRFVLSSTVNGELILWDFSTHQELRRLSIPVRISGALFDPDGDYIYAITLEKKLFIWPVVEKTLPELKQWIADNRYVRDLTCQEKQQYNVEPLCTQ